MKLLVSAITCIVVHGTNLRRLTIFGTDDRIAVDATSAASLPYSAIGKIVFSDESYCMATLISPSYILTASSCFYQNQIQKDTVAGAKFYSSLTDGPSAMIVSLRIATKQPEIRRGFNVALAKLEQPLGRTLGYIPLLDAKPSDLPEETTVSLLQFSSQGDLMEQKNVNMHYDATSEAPSKPQIAHDGDTDDSQTIGAALIGFNAESSQHEVWGIHSEGGSTQMDEFDLSQANYGVAWHIVQSRYHAVYTKDIEELSETTIGDGESPRDEQTDDSTLTTASPKAGDPTNQTESDDTAVASSATVYVCIAIIFAVWVSVVVVMRRMSR